MIGIATAEEFRTAVHAPSFERAKNDIELELGQYIDAMLRNSAGHKGSTANVA